MRRFVLIILVGALAACGASTLACSKPDEGLLRRVSGNYQITSSTWNDSRSLHLYIGTHQGDDRFFAIYDNGGKTYGEEMPWIEGSIVIIDDDSMTVEIDESSFNAIPSGWQSEGSTLTFSYAMDAAAISLSNAGQAAVFERQEYAFN